MRIQQESALNEFNQFYKEMDELYHAVALKAGLSDSALDILYSLCILGDGCLQKEICQLAFISKQTVNSSIRKLEQQQYLVLQSGKGRDMHIYLTEAGQALVQEKVIPIIQAENQAFGRMSAAEQKELLRLNKIYLSYLQQSLLPN